MIASMQNFSNVLRGRAEAPFILGVLMLDTRFPRIPGEIGNPDTFPFPVIYRVVDGANVQKVILKGDHKIVSRFIEAAKLLELEKVDLIATTCGYMARFQDEIGRALSIPFISSSLLLLPLLYRAFGKRGPLGVLTASRRHLTPVHFRGVGASDVPVVVSGMDACDHFNRAIMKEEIPLDRDCLEAEVVGLAKRLSNRHPSVPAILLECTNLSPYRGRIREVTGRPVFDIFTAISMFL